LISGSIITSFGIRYDLLRGTDLLVHFQVKPSAIARQPNERRRKTVIRSEAALNLIRFSSGIVIGDDLAMQQKWHEAAINGDCETIRACLAQSADINRLDKYGQTALMLASLHGNDAVIEMLVENGAELDITAKFGLSALMLAVINNHENTARLLVRANANIWLKGRGAPGFSNKTAFDLAKDNGLSDSTELLIKSAADRARNLIEAAFADRARPAHLFDSKQLLDFEYDEVMLFDQMRWQDVEIAHVDRAPDAVFWFSPEAFCYYLPGFLVAGLRENNVDSNAFDSIIGCLDRSPEPDYWDDFFRPRFTQFKVSELEAVSAWVRWMEMVQPDAFDPITYQRAQDTLELLKWQATG